MSKCFHLSKEKKRLSYDKLTLGSSLPCEYLLKAVSVGGSAYRLSCCDKKRRRMRSIRCDSLWKLYFWILKSGQTAVGIQLFNNKDRPEITPDGRDAFIMVNYSGQEAKSFFFFFFLIIGPRCFLYTGCSWAHELLWWVDVVSVGRRSSAEC